MTPSVLDQPINRGSQAITLNNHFYPKRASLPTETTGHNTHKDQLGVTNNNRQQMVGLPQTNKQLSLPPSNHKM